MIAIDKAWSTPPVIWCVWLSPRSPWLHMLNDAQYLYDGSCLSAWRYTLPLWGVTIMGTTREKKNIFWLTLPLPCWWYRILNKQIEWCFKLSYHPKLSKFMVPLSATPNPTQFSEHCDTRIHISHSSWHIIYKIALYMNELKIDPCKRTLSLTQYSQCRH